MKHLHIRRFAATGAGLALAATGMAISMSPAQAESATLNYTCEVPALGGKTFTVVADTSAPAKMQAGTSTKASITAKVTIPEDVAGLISGALGASTVEGTASSTTTVNGKNRAVDLTIPNTEIPDGELTIVASGAAKIAATKAGKLVLGTGDFSADLLFLKEDGSEALAAEVPCTLDEGQNATVDTVKVVKAKSTTKVQKVKGKKKKAVVKVKVKSKTSAKATGKVKITLKGPKKVTKKVKVNKKGVAKVTVKKLKKGKYKVVAKYLGNKNVKASKGKAKGKVKVK